MDNKTEKYIINKLRSAGCVFAEDEARLLISEARTPEVLKKMVEMRANGLPFTRTFEIFSNSGLSTKIARDEELDATVVIGTKFNS